MSSEKELYKHLRIMEEQETQLRAKIMEVGNSFANKPTNIGLSIKELLDFTVNSKNQLRETINLLEQSKQSKKKIERKSPLFIISSFMGEA